MKLNSLFLGICLLSLPVVADTQTEILTDKLERLEAEMALLQKKVYQAPETIPQKGSSNLPANIDEFYTTLDTQNQYIQELTVKNEQMAHELSELKSQLNRINEDINFRLNELKEKPATIKENKETVPSPSTDFISESESYNKAYNLLKNGEYEKAEQAFITFMEKYPDGKLTGNANYWLGESYYARQKWPEAAGLFADGFTKYKDNNKAPDAMFKLGLTMKQMDKKKEACTAFKSLITSYPTLGKTLIERSQKEIKEMQCP